MAYLRKRDNCLVVYKYQQMRVRDNYLIHPELVQPRVPLKGSRDFCPRCGGILIVDLVDLACLACGWRECGYFLEKRFPVSV